MLPSWIKSRNCIPRPTYRLAIETTNRKLASANSCLATSSPFSIRKAKATSSSAVKRLTRPISFRYIRTGSLIFTPVGADVSLSFKALLDNFSVALRARGSGSPFSSTTLIPASSTFCIKLSIPSAFNPNGVAI